jgi:hypothetical protein
MTVQYAPVERADTLPFFQLYPYMYSSCGPDHQRYQRRYLTFVCFYCIFIRKVADVLLDLILKGIIWRAATAAGDLCLEFLKATPEI